MKSLTVAALQMSCGPVREANIDKAVALVRQAAREGAQIVLLPELFETPYFCKDHDYGHLKLATPTADNPALARLAPLACELQVVLPVSIYERDGNTYYNTLVMVGSEGEILGTYRKSHIPESPGYHEKFYFAPGDTGFRVWPTRYAATGVAVCWDQWFPEAARVMALQGAELFLYPTAIGSEPQDPTLDSRDHWMRTMQGHAAANIVPLVCANRYGEERGATNTITFYGSSFIADHTGAIAASAGRSGDAVLCARFDLEAIEAYRRNWGVYRDRRPELYGALLTLDGRTRAGGP
jgi:N-carbamoylputrescine amidase